VHSHPLSSLRSNSHEMSGRTQLERAINQISDRGPAPDIDFTQHQLENGYTISTQERVVKEVLHLVHIPVVFSFLTSGAHYSPWDCDCRSKPRR
jgi:hypothetical protein